MSRNSFVEVKRYIITDNKDCQNRRLVTDKFVNIREILEAIVNNFIKNYTPDWSLTFDRYLLPIRNRCPFIVFTPNKPDKFGMKL